MCVQDLEEEWSTRVLAEMHDRMQSKFDFFQRDAELYAKSQLRRLLVRIPLLLSLLHEFVYLLSK